VNRTLEESLAWSAEGTELCRKAIASLDEPAYAAPTLLAGWSRRHLVAHLAANAEAIGRLVSWARTGRETRMYSSPGQRQADIEAGAKLSGRELTAWFDRSAGELSAAMAALPADAWQSEVVTAQGRIVPASETPWMRAREVMVHAVDLEVGLTFADLPEGFLTALRADIIGKRGAQNVPDVRGSTAAVTAYLAGRPFTDVTAPDGQLPEQLPPWL
jgi:maleylpyruvate isomerase